MKQLSSQKNESILKACVVLPTYNEAENIESIIKAIFAMQSNVSTHKLYVIVVDDNSPDGTQGIVKQQMQQFPQLHLVTGNKVGLGDAYKRGISFAITTFNPDLLLQMDADGQHDPKLIPEFINLANNDFSLVIGSRFIDGGKTPDFSIWRKFLSILANWLVRNLGGVKHVKDCTSGFRCIKANLISKCDFNYLSTKGYSFQSSLVYELIRHGAKPIEIPIIFKDRVKGQSKLTLADQIEFLINIGKITFHKSEDFIKFCCVGLVGAIVNIGSYLLLERRFQIPSQVAINIAIEISIVSNFFFNNYWTFKKRTKNLPVFLRLVIFNIVSLVTTVIFYNLLFFFLFMKLGMNDVISILISITAGTISNFTINSILTWRK
jgi:dolichol-phosphate mannosyltransferase